MLYLGVNADREAMSDLDVPPSLPRESLDELLAAAQRVAPALRCGDE
jgi:diacylglycerol O-acyltransferase